jgi:hypothetical protein
MCETASVPSSAPWQPLEVLGFVLTAVTAIVPIDQLESVHWYHHPGEQSLIEVTLSDGETVGAYIPGGDTGAELGIGYAICSVFDSLQQDLPYIRQLWGLALPGCRAGHPHPALIREQDGAVQLYCPSDQQTLRALVILP